MQISAIRYNMSCSYPKKNSTKHTAQQSFKGYTHELENFSSQFDMNGGYYLHKSFVKYRYPDRLEDTGVRLKWEELTPRERDIYSRDEGYMPRIYIASPYEEIPPEIYKTHTHIQKNDLWMSQIKKDSMEGFMNFACNATCEMEHYKELQAKRDEIIDKNTKEIELLKERHEETLKNCPENINAKVEEKYNNRISQLEKEIEEAKQKTERVDKNMEKAERRYDVLKKLDDICRQITSKKQEIYELSSYSIYGSNNFRIGELKEDVEKLEKIYQIRQEQVKRLRNMTSSKIVEIALEKSEEAMFAIEQKIEDAKRQINNLSMNEDVRKAFIDKINNEEIPEIQEKIKEELKNVEKFYRQYYPEWCDV